MTAVAFRRRPSNTLTDVDWSTFNQVQLHRLWQRLREHERFYLEVRIFLKKYGFAPSDPLVVNNELSLRQVHQFIELVEVLLERFAPYRPLVNPWKNSGLAAHLRPDFKARGITERPPPNTDKK